MSGKKILHIATHGAFVPNDPYASYLLSGTGSKIPISEIQLLQNLGDIHLVVLSACETALGGPNQDGIEISGISSYFLGTSKAKAVIASLWKVSDESTSQLMQNFYNNLANSNPSMTKSQALRQAQLSLLYGKQTANRRQGRGIVQVIPVQPSKTPTTNSNYSHPYYWAPFILIGNGL